MDRALRVILDDRPLRRTLTGVGNYIAQLLTHLPRFAPDVQVDPFVFTYLRRGGWNRPASAPPGTHEVGRVRHPRDVGGSRKPWWLRRTRTGRNENGGSSVSWYRLRK